MAPALPPCAPFPEAPWRDHIVPEEWEACLILWVSLAEAHLSLPQDDFQRISVKDESLYRFLVIFTREIASSGITILGSSESASKLLRHGYMLITGVLKAPAAPANVLHWEFLSDFSRVYGKKRTSSVLAQLFKEHTLAVETSLHGVKKSLILALDAGIKNDLRIPEARLKHLNHLIHASPDTAALFMAGTDFLDGLISCYKIMNPPLRKTIVATAYLCLIGLTESKPPKYSTLIDQLYSLKAAADVHRAGPTSGNDSMVAELVTVTPLLKQVQHRLEQSGSTTTRMKAVISGLESFKKPGGNVRPKRLVKRKVDKGKGVMNEDEDEEIGQLRVHQMSQISQIQDLFPDLGSGFISQLLDEFQNETEQVVAHLLENNLPPQLASADRSRVLSPERTRRRRSSLAPRPTPPQLPTRHNVFDDDELDNLTLNVSNLHFGKRSPGKTADDILKDRTTAPNKAAILSALSAFDADDDERDDTYDAADAGFTVNDALADDADDQKRKDIHEETLFKVYKTDPKLFSRDSDMRRGNYRAKLKQDTGMTDEAIEGWAIMLSRNPQQLKSLEMKYSAAGSFAGDQPALAPTAWPANPADSGAEESGQDSGSSNQRGGFRGRGRGRGRGGGRGGNVSGPTGEKGTENARRNKEANKSSRANHNRREGRARKMARAGFPG
ncbi:CUE domain-containing protein [Seiridium cupressi]